MEKLEQYLDQVCRSVGGPIEMRQHLRQELREHLLDSIAQHKAQGKSDLEALEAALAEFGKPDDVRTDLEAAHGQRMIWIIDKTLQWKEMTMRAKWLWVSWAYLGLGLVIALQVLFITFNVVFIVPKYKKLMHDGYIDRAIVDDEGARWMVNYLNELSDVAGNHTLLLILVPALLWVLFEWRVQSENKSFMRLSALGSAAIALTIVVMLMSGSLVITFCLGVPAMGRMARPWAVEQVREVESQLKGFEAMTKAGKFTAKLEPTQAKGFRLELRVEMTATSNALTRLSVGPALRSLTQRNDAAAVEELWGHLRAAQEHVREAEKAIDASDLTRFEREIDNLRKAFAPIQEAAAKLPDR